MGAYHKLHCTSCKREMVISFQTLQCVVPHEIMKQPKDPEHDDQFFLWKGDYCFMCNVEKINAQHVKQKNAPRTPYSPPAGWTPPEVKQTDA